MNKYYLSLLIASLISLGAWSQSVSYTIKPGSNSSSAKVFIRATGEITGVISQSLITFTLPASVTPIPSANLTMAAPFAHMGHTAMPVTTENISGSNYLVFNFYNAYVGTITNTLPANTELEFCEIQFGYPGNLPSELRLVSLPDGGSNTISYTVLEVGGTNRTSETAIVYGNGAVSGGSFSAYSFVPLNIVLPVKFLSFFALKNGDDAKLNWTVESDENNRYFEIERSTDGRVFKTIGKVDAKANGKTTNTYETVDAGITKLGANLVYYRIKQTDKNGELTYSNVKNLNNVKKSTPVQLFPNPVKNVTKVVVDADAAGKGSIIIRDVTGKMVRQINAQFVKGINQQDINVADLASGDYNVQVIGEGFTYQLKLSKIN